jgi:Domain of unknown function (DUF4258)
MKCTYTHHAREQMATRRITELEVEATLDDYHTSYTDRKGNPIFIGHPNGRRIKVIVKVGSHPPRIITAAD